jgi:hypothetical protein
MLRHLTWLLVLWPLVGCNSTKNSSSTTTIPKTDPLLGSGPPVKPASYTPPPNSQPIALQAPTAPSNTMSTAELAAGIHQPLDNDHDLRIGNPNAPANPAQGDGWRAQGSGQGGPSVALNRPEPIADVDSRQPTSPGPNAALTSGSTASANNGDPSLEQLRARGMVWVDMRFNAQTGDWDVACAFPNRQNPDVQRTYEVHAKDQASGLRAILDRVNQDR